MLTIMKFEWKKIWKSRINKIAMAAGFLLVIVCVATWIAQAYYYDVETGEYVYGVGAIRYNQEQAAGMAKVLTEEYLAGVVEEIQEEARASGAESPEDYWVAAKGLDLNNLPFLLAMQYAKDRDDWTARNWRILGDIPVQGGINFYGRRLEKIGDLLNMSYSYGDYTPEEKSFWMEKAGRVEMPYAWGDTFMMSCMMDLLLIGFYLVLVVMVCLAPVFAAEYETGADRLLLTTRYGPSRLIWAKIFMAVLFSLGYYLVTMVCGGLILAVVGGLPGGSLPVQLWKPLAPYSMTLAQACAGALGMMVLMAVAFALFTLMLSARVKSSFAVLVIDVSIFLGPAFFPFSKTSRLWNRINYLFPVRAFNLKEVLEAYNSYQFGGVVVSYLGMVVIVYFVVAIVSLLGIRGGFAKHEVKG